jgi:hypothetical protein
LQRTKTDHVDALGIARFAAQKRPKLTSGPSCTRAASDRAPPAALDPTLG